MEHKDKISLVVSSLSRAYPDFIAGHDGTALIWRDGERTSILPEQQEHSDGRDAGLALCDQFRWRYPTGQSSFIGPSPNHDPGRIRYEPLFKKMYGATCEGVEKKLVRIAWLPKTTNETILVTTVNGVDKKLGSVSRELDELPKNLKKYVRKISGTYCWRTIEGTQRISTHSFGIAIDINIKFANYWQWDVKNKGRMTYKNKIPHEIVEIFEKNGFIWGGKWYHYDTMHFEYRPELLVENYLMNTDSHKYNIIYLTQGRELYGSQRQLSYLVKNIDTTIYEPFIVHAEPMENNGFDILKHDNFISVKLRPWRKLRNIFLRYIDAYNLLITAKSKNPSLIHCSYQWLYPYALFVGKRLNIPVVQHIRRPGTSEKKSNNSKYAEAHAIIVISKRIEDELTQINALQNLVFRVDDAVDDAFFTNGINPLLKNELGITDGVLFGIVGRIYKSKRQLEFVMAAKQLIIKGTNAYFFIIGKVDDENYYKELRNYISTHNLSGRIFFTGHRQDMPDVLSSLDVLVSLSGGSVMYEAMACGKVVISAGFTHKKNAVHLQDGLTGLVTESREIGVLVSLMEKVSNHQELRRVLGENARRWADSHFGGRELAAKTQAIYARLLNDSAKSAAAMHQTP